MQPNPRVLFVDDEPHVLAAIMRQLRKELDIVTACGGGPGLRELSSGPPFSVVVADMQMPEMDGISFLSRAKELQPNAVRIMLTGNADQISMQRAEEAGIFKYLSKPCRPEALLATIRDAIDRYAA